MKSEYKNGENSQVYDIIIIGGGPAGYTAATYAARAGFDTLLIERMAAGGQMTLTGDIDNYPGFEDGIDGFTLGAKMQAGAERFGAKTEYGEVISVSLSERIKRVETKKKSYLSKAVIIATGANPRELGLPREKELIGRGIHYCAHCDGRFYKDKTVIVVGGGNSAAADALYLSRLAKKVYIAVRRDALRATKVYHDPLIAAENIEFLWSSNVSDVIEDNGALHAVIKSSTNGEERKISVDGIFVSIGRKPATELFADSISLDGNGYIIAGEDTKTNIPGIYAVGDVRSKPLRQVVTAVADGAVAVHYAEEYIANWENV